MKKYILSALLAIFWASPAGAFTVLNDTIKIRTVSVFSGDQGTQFGKVKIPDRQTKTVTIPAESKLLDIYVSTSSLLPARTEMTNLGSYAALQGQWIIIGKDERGRPLLTRLIPASKKEIIPANAKSIYTLINDDITRVDTLPEETNTADTHAEILEKPSYRTHIDPQSYIVVTHTTAVKVTLYDPVVIKYAAAKQQIHKNS